MTYSRFANPFDLSFHFLLFLLFSAIVVFVVLKAPWKAYTLVISSSILCSGFLINTYTFADEIILFIILSSAVLGRRIGRHHYLPICNSEVPLAESRLRLVFKLFILYMLGIAIYGVFYTSSPRRLRWVIFFLLVLWLARLTDEGALRVTTNRNLAFYISLSGLIYFAFYLVNGVYFDVILGSGRFFSQRIQWGTSSYSFFPVVLIVPVSIVLCRDRKPFFRAVGLSAMTVALIAAFFYDCRSGIVIFFLFVVLNLKLVPKKLYIIGGIIVLISILSGLASFLGETEDKTPLMEKLTSPMKTLIDPDSSNRDIDRVIFIRSVLRYAVGDPLKLFLGVGYNVHASALRPYAQSLFDQYLLRHFEVEEDFGVEAFTAQLVDAGIIGNSLLIIYLVMLFRTLSRVRTMHRKLWLTTIFAIGIYSLFINYRDMVLVYLMIMPNGVLMTLSEST